MIIFVIQGINANSYDWRHHMAKGRDKAKPQEKKKAQKSIKEKRKQKKEKGTKSS
jgi:hypothetical protein